MTGLGLGGQAPLQAGRNLRDPPAHTDGRLLRSPLDEPVMRGTSQGHDDSMMAAEQLGPVAIADPQIRGQRLQIHRVSRRTVTDERQPARQQHRRRPDERSPHQLGIRPHEGNTVGRPTIKVHKSFHRRDRSWR